MSERRALLRDVLESLRQSRRWTAKLAECRPEGMVAGPAVSIGSGERKPSSDGAGLGASDGMALVRAVETLCVQTGEDPAEFARWLTEGGGLVKMALAYFRVANPDAPTTEADA